MAKEGYGARVQYLPVQSEERRVGKEWYFPGHGDGGVHGPEIPL